MSTGYGGRHVLVLFTLISFLRRNGYVYIAIWRFEEYICLRRHLHGDIAIMCFEEYSYYT